MEVGADGTQVFRAARGGAMVWLAGLMALLAAGSVMAGLAAPRGWGLILGGLFFGGISWLVLRNVFTREPVLVVGPTGIGAYMFKGHTVPWSDVEDIEIQSIQGQQSIQVVLHEGAASRAPTRRWLNSGTKRGIPLGLLRAADRKRAVDALMQAFGQHATVQALAAAGKGLEALRSDEAFEARLRALTPVPWALYAVTAINIGVWLLNLLDGMSPVKPASAELFAWGANSASAVVRDGEYWRLITATVLHGGVMHLLLNLYALWVAGGQVCRWFGNGQFLMIYLGSALAGSALSLHFSALQSVSVGASGAVFGVLGALLMGVVQHKERLPKGKLQQLLTSQGLFVVFALVQGFGKQGIDNAAHVGGLLAGAAMAWVLIEMVDEQASAAQRRSRQWVATLTVALAVVGLVWQAKPGVDHRMLFGASSAMNQILPRISAAESALQQDAKAVQAGRMSEAQLLEAMTQRHIPAYRDIHRTLLAIGPAGSLPGLGDLQTLYALTVELMTLEVDKHQGRIDAAQADGRMATLRTQLEAVRARLQQRNAGKAVKP